MDITEKLYYEELLDKLRVENEKLKRENARLKKIDYDRSWSSENNHANDWRIIHEMGS